MKETVKYPQKKFVTEVTRLRRSDGCTRNELMYVYKGRQATLPIVIKQNNKKRMRMPCAPTIGRGSWPWRHIRLASLNTEKIKNVAGVNAK